MQCQNIKCRYYRAPTRRELWEINFGVKEKFGGCSFPYCKKGQRKAKVSEIIWGLLLDFIVYACTIIYFYW
jgi:hypothetical protein